jgi:hypothetical protein
VSPNRGRDHSEGRRGGRHFDRGRGGAVVYPFVFFGYDGGGYSDGGAVVRTSPDASYVIEGHLDEAAVERRSRVYEVGPRAGEDAYADTEPAESELAPGDEPAPDGGSFDLIALQGGLIYAVREHWLLGNTVHFVTLQGDHYVVSLQEVDLDLSVRLNRERGRKFLLEVREHDGAASPGLAP